MVVSEVEEWCGAPMSTRSPVWLKSAIEPS